MLVSVVVLARTYLTTILSATRYLYNNNDSVVVVVLVRTYLTTILSATRYRYTKGNRREKRLGPGQLQQHIRGPRHENEQRRHQVL